MIKTEIRIRKIKKNELNQLINLCEEHAVFEEAEYDREGKSEQLEKYLWGTAPVLSCLVASSGDELLGYITYTKEFSTWSADFFYHMDCLYLNGKARNLGLGKKMMNAMVEDAHQKGIKHIQWQTPVANTNAIDFYHHFGATSKPKIRFFLDL